MKITVITPVLDGREFIASNLRSIVAQTHDDVEHIIVDGGSTDGTLDEVESFRQRYEDRGFTLKVLSGKDSGIYDAMSRGVSLATGDIVGILNSDDYLYSPDLFSVISGTFKGHPEVDAVYGDVNYVDRGDTSRVTRFYSSAPFSRRMMLFGMQPPHPSLYCRREVYSRFGAYDVRYRISGDFDFMLRTIYHGRIRTHRLPRTMVTMRSGGATDRSLATHLKGLWEHQLAYMRCRVPSCILLDVVQLAFKAIQLHPPRS